MTEEKQSEIIEEQTKEVAKKEEKPVKKEQKPQIKRTLCWLISKADYIIEVKLGEQTSFIQPFGRIKVVKEQVQINPNDARYLTFARIK